MDCLAMLKSGNYVFHLCRILEQQGFVFEVVSTPCHIAREGCGFCLKLPEEYLDIVIGVGRENRIPVTEAYRIRPAFSKNHYERIY